MKGYSGEIIKGYCVSIKVFVRAETRKKAEQRIKYDLKLDGYEEIWVK